jgi:hypothetical protein
VPDFIARCRPDLNLIVEVSGEAKKDKAAKWLFTAGTHNVRAEAVLGAFGRWAFVDVTDPLGREGPIRAAIAAALATA